MSRDLSQAGGSIQAMRRLPAGSVLEQALAGRSESALPCLKMRGYADADPLEGATIIGGAKLAQFLSGDGTGVFS